MADAHDNARLETFCDGVFAIAITLLVLDVALPATAKISTTAEFWKALFQLTPQIYAFVLSFVVIFITWVNHHNFLQLIKKTSAAFIYANGFLLLAIVLVPFPTNLLGEYILTDHAGPAVVAYNAVFALQAVGWVLMSRSAVNGHLSRGEAAEPKIRQIGRDGSFAIVVYACLAVIGLWFPKISAALTTLIWMFWLAWGIGLLKFKERQRS